MTQEWSFGNAAGTCKSVADVEHYARSALDTVNIGSLTVEKSDGNAGTNHYRNSAFTSSNALGLNNGGIPYYRRALQEMIDIIHAAGKKASVSLAPKGPDDVEKGLELLARHNLDIVEFNGGCPNVWKDGRQTRIHAYDPEGLARDLIVFNEFFPDSGLVEKRYKDSYTPDSVLLAEKAEVFRPHRITLVEMNTLANGLMFAEDGRAVIPFGKHLGGMSGPEFRPLALGQILLLKELLPEHSFIGVMGIRSWRDIQEYLSIGVSGVQIGGEFYYTENYRLASDILQESIEM